MLDASLLFSSPPSSIGDVISTVLEIFGQEWKTLMGLSALYLFSAFSLGCTIMLFLAIFFAKDIQMLVQLIQQANEGMMNRHLLDYSVGISGASRFLEDYYYKDSEQYNEYNPADDFDFDPNKLAVFPVMLVLAFVVLAIFAGVLNGSMTHASKYTYFVGKMKTFPF